MTRTAGAQIGCQRPSRFWGLGCPKIYQEAEDTLEPPRFDSVEAEFREKLVKLDLLDDAPGEKKENKSNRLKYSCTGCGINVWGKPQLKINCVDCDLLLIET